jgi:hypothetical protein
VTAVFGLSPLPPVILFLNIPVMLTGFAISAWLRSDVSTYLTAVVSASTIGVAIYVYLRQPRWSIPPWLRATRTGGGSGR